MNNDYEKKNKEKPDKVNNESKEKSGNTAHQDELDRRKPRMGNSHNKKQLRMGTGVVLCLLAFVVLYAVVNLSAITSVAEAAITILTPVILGFAILSNGLPNCR